MKSNVFMAVCMTAIFSGKVFQEGYLNALQEIDLLTWLITIAFLGSWIKFFMKLKFKKHKIENNQ